MEYKIIIAGFGGQGVLFAGKVLAQAAMLCGYQVTWLPSYGPEMRGGTANCQLVISDNQIGSPMIKNADILIAMNLPSLIKFKGVTKGLIITDERFVQGISSDADVVGMNTNLCNGGGRFEGLTNMIMIGALLAKINIFDIQYVKEAIEAITNPSVAQLDICAVEYGYDKAEIKKKIVS